jgi:hypothetical protein
MTKEIAPHVFAAHTAASRRLSCLEVPGHLVYRSDLFLWQFVPALDSPDLIDELDKLATPDRLNRATMTVKPETV